MAHVRTRLLPLVVAGLAVFACSDGPATPEADQGSPAFDPSMALILDDPWLSSFLEVQDAGLRNELIARTGRADRFQVLVADRLSDREALSPDDAIALSVLDLTLLVAASRPSTEAEPR